MTNTTFNHYRKTEQFNRRNEKMTNTMFNHSRKAEQINRGNETMTSATIANCSKIEWLKRSIDTWTDNHPYIATYILLVGMPTLCVGSVMLATSLVTLPVSLIMGWL